MRIVQWVFALAAAFCAASSRFYLLALNNTIRQNWNCEKRNREIWAKRLVVSSTGGLLSTWDLFMTWLVAICCKISRIKWMCRQVAQMSWSQILRRRNKDRTSDRAPFTWTKKKRCKWRKTLEDSLKFSLSLEKLTRGRQEPRHIQRRKFSSKSQKYRNAHSSPQGHFRWSWWLALRCLTSTISGPWLYQKNGKKNWPGAFELWWRQDEPPILIGTWRNSRIWRREHL